MREGDVADPRVAPRPPSRIREYISNVAFSRERLLALMERNDLDAELRQVNPQAAVTSMRQALEVDVVRNYFLLDRRVTSEPRTALVVIRYRDTSPERALAVIHDVGELLTQHERGERLTQLAGAKASAEREAVRARTAVRELRQRDADLVERSARAPARERGELSSRLATTESELTAALRRLQELERRAAALELSRLAELSYLGLSFDRVDERVRAGREPLSLPRAAAVALAGVLLLAPAIAIVLGAFDRRVHRATDVTAAGFPLLGDLSLLERGPSGSHRGA
jgi:hypothetical protein